MASFDSGNENWHDFEVGSRREIISLLRSIGEKNQLIRAVISGDADAAVTSVLDVDPDAGEVLLDCSINADQNRRMLNARKIRFETSLDKIRILFNTEGLRQTTYRGSPAFAMAIPETMIRLQRREYYRMPTPVTNPVRALITVQTENGPEAHSFPLADISCGGIALLDHKMLLDNTAGKNYENCRIDLPEVGTVVTTLQVRNSIDMTLLNNKPNRRLGCEFINLQRGMLALVQRYITKLERERNARMAGLG